MQLQQRKESNAVCSSFHEKFPLVSFPLPIKPQPKGKQINTAIFLPQLKKCRVEEVQHHIARLP